MSSAHQHSCDQPISGNPPSSTAPSNNSNFVFNPNAVPFVPSQQHTRLWTPCYCFTENFVVTQYPPNTVISVFACFIEKISHDNTPEAQKFYRYHDFFWNSPLYQRHRMVDVLYRRIHALHDLTEFPMFETNHLFIGVQSENQNVVLIWNPDEFITHLEMYYMTFGTKGHMVPRIEYVENNLSHIPSVMEINAELTESNIDTNDNQNLQKTNSTDVTELKEDDNHEQETATVENQGNVESTSDILEEIENFSIDAFEIKSESPKLPEPSSETLKNHKIEGTNSPDSEEMKDNNPLEQETPKVEDQVPAISETTSSSNILEKIENFPNDSTVEIKPESPNLSEQTSQTLQNQNVDQTKSPDGKEMKEDYYSEQETTKVENQAQRSSESTSLNDILGEIENFSIDSTVEIESESSQLPGPSSEALQNQKIETTNSSDAKEMKKDNRAKNKNKKNSKKNSKKLKNSAPTAQEEKEKNEQDNKTLDHAMKLNENYYRNCSYTLTLTQIDGFIKKESHAMKLFFVTVGIGRDLLLSLLPEHVQEVFSFWKTRQTMDMSVYSHNCWEFLIQRIKAYETSNHSSAIEGFLRGILEHWRNAERQRVFIFHIEFLKSIDDEKTRLMEEEEFYATFLRSSENEFYPIVKLPPQEEVPVIGNFIKMLRRYYITQSLLRPKKQYTLEEVANRPKVLQIVLTNMGDVKDWNPKSTYDFCCQKSERYLQLKKEEKVAKGQECVATLWCLMSTCPSSILDQDLLVLSEHFKEDFSELENEYINMIFCP